MFIYNNDGTRVTMYNRENTRENYGEDDPNKPQTLWEKHKTLWIVLIVLGSALSVVAVGLGVRWYRKNNISSSQVLSEQSSSSSSSPSQQFTFNNRPEKFKFRFY